MLQLAVTRRARAIKLHTMAEQRTILFPVDHRLLPNLHFTVAAAAILVLISAALIRVVRYIIAAPCCAFGSLARRCASAAAEPLLALLLCRHGRHQQLRAG